MKNQTTHIIFTTTLLALCQLAPAVVPAPDGGYPGGNTAEGQAALLSLTTGTFNTAVGFLALRGDTTAGFNTAVGAGTLLANTSDRNTATGAGALLSNTNAADNTANGAFALLNNTTGAANTAVGAGALFANIGASNNTALGVDALHNNTADGNTATGAFALHDNTTGGTVETVNVNGTLFDLGPNTAVGFGALTSNLDSSGNTAVGYQALRSMVSGASQAGWPQLAINTAVGFQALANANGDTNFANSAFGYQALFNFTNGYYNTAVGTLALADLDVGAGNVAIGTGAGLRLATGTGNIYIGSGLGPPIGVTSESGHTYIGNINDTSVSGGGTDTVTVDLATGLLGHLTSSRRHKEDIKPMENASETLYRLKPVTYRYKKEIDRKQVRDYGLIAEDVAEIDPNLTARNRDGQIESVRYNAINAMLLNEFLKEHRKNQQQETTITQLQRDFQANLGQQQKQIEALTTNLQKVSAQLEVSKHSPQVVVRNQ